METPSLGRSGGVIAVLIGFLEFLCHASASTEAAKRPLIVVAAEQLAL